MKTDTTNGNPTQRDATLSSNVVFDLLADERRRRVLYYLSHKVGPVSLDELAEYVADREEAPTSIRAAEIRLEFQHNHLWKLVDSDVLRYDPATDTVERKPAARSLDPHLELAFVEDINR
ncbi:DUF7344 domain-containing protein [Natrarchaeobius oligotrophus]|uniref:DUF7344 domain-containing protein n=1 Tax=Natrarchaeobius chitinivorans TaxID=1679083 RepID=A0A3N6N2P8_NATCH|nr:hypothetical protein [Natrarchaeobius chitinivorans]RQH01937.1 hypothetical protein EA472_06440 [Natrarchaeobius chitinivorans]